MSREAVTVRTDNAGALINMKEARSTPALRHVGVRYHYGRDLVLKGEVTAERVPSSDNVADIFTKALPQVTFEKLRAYILS